MTNEKRRKKDSARLVWDTKPRRAPNPRDIEFQTAEVVIPNATRDESQIPLSFKDGLFGEEDLDKQKMNRLIWGDNLLAMQALLAQGYEGMINLIYIDPPFDSKADYSHKMTIEGNEVVKEPSVIERLAYKDTWSGGTDSYLDMLYPRLQLMKRLLADDGNIFVHLDWHVGHYAKIILDEVFGYDNFLNEIIWYYYNKLHDSRKKLLPRAHDIILRYTKHIGIQKHNPLKEPRAKPVKKLKYKKVNGQIQNIIGENGKAVTYMSTDRTIDDVWRIRCLQPANKEEWLDYKTQKPEDFMTRILTLGSGDGDLVFDCFAGSGTTLIAAERLGKRWIGCELGKVGVQVVRARLVEMDARPFIIENIGNYQREMIYLTGGRIWEMQHLILKLYEATPRDKMSGLGIRKAEDETEELVYVGYPDRPVTAHKAEELVLQAQKLDGRGYRRLIILGWDYEYNYHQALEARLKALKDKVNVKIESRDIPPDIYDYLKKARSEEEIEALSEKVQFYERPYLKMAEPKVKDVWAGQAEISLAIKRYVLMDVPISQSSKKGQENYQALMKLAKDNFAVLIDYWAVDWDYDGFTFKSQWQAFRGNGRKAKTVPTQTSEVLDKRKRTIAVRVVDIFGNDAGVTLEI